MDNIARFNGIDAIAYQGQTPWHHKGQKLGKDATVADALDAAGLRYTVETREVFLAGGVLVENFKATVRLDVHNPGVEVFLGMVGQGYEVGQNEKVAKIAEALERIGCRPAAAGALGNGERAWILMRLPEAATVTPVDGDDVRGYFLIHWGHDGSVGVTGLCTPIRVICQNTLNAAVADGGRSWFSLRHSASLDARIDDAAALVQRLTAEMIASGETFASMARQQLTAAQVAEFVARVTPNTDSKSQTASPVIQARRDTIARLVFWGRGAAMANQLVDTREGGASIWAVYNAVTEYYDHVRPGEAKSEAGVSRANESALFGGNALLKANALVAARQLVAV